MKINEIFQSINGEVTAWHQGSLTTFVRFSGCNLACSYCDAAYAKEINHELSVMDIYDILEKTGCKQVTLTGGEPAIQDDFAKLIEILDGTGYKITIETNGTKKLIPTYHTSWVIDYKFDYAEKMMIENFYLMGERDWLKFVINYHSEMYVMLNLFKIHPALNYLNIAVGTTGKVSHAEIVDFLIHNKLYNCVLNYQIHKEIWKNKKEGQKIL